MNRDLLVALDDAESADELISELEDSIRALSDRQYSTLTLLAAYKDAVIDAELKWRQLEQREDFKARYTSREEAHADYLKNYFSR